MKHIKNIKTEKSYTKKVAPLFLWVLVSFLIISYVFLTIEMATKGAVLAKIVDEENGLREANRELSTRLIKESSLMSLEMKAKELGFIKPLDIIYILEPGGVAKVP